MCLLSTGSGKYITVPFSNIGQNAFTANISGAISQQNVPKLGMCTETSVHDVMMHCVFSCHFQLC